MNQNTLFQIATWLIPLIIAIVFHEVSHGLVARRLGDPTAAERGRSATRRSSAGPSPSR